MNHTRSNEVTFKGNPVDLAGPHLKVGDKAPDFECVDDSLSVVNLGATGGKVRLFSVVPSLDTPVCSVQTKTFADKFNALGDKAEAYTISLDMPFAMKRFCADNQLTNMKNLSDVRNKSFGEHYGTLITSLPMPLLVSRDFRSGRQWHDQARGVCEGDRHGAGLRRGDQGRRAGGWVAEDLAVIEALGRRSRRRQGFVAQPVISYWNWPFLAGAQVHPGDRLALGQS